MDINSVGSALNEQGIHAMKGSGKSEGDGQKAQMLAKLEAAGITKEQVMRAKAEGPEAVKALFRGTGIAPPAQALSGGKQVKNEGNSITNSKDIMSQIEDAGVSKEEFKTAQSQGPEAMKSLFEKYELDIDIIV